MPRHAALRLMPCHAAAAAAADFFLISSAELIDFRLLHFSFDAAPLPTPTLLFI